jgi:hypothetical protein
MLLVEYCDYTITWLEPSDVFAHGKNRTGSVRAGDDIGFHTPRILPLWNDEIAILGTLLAQIYRSGKQMIHIDGSALDCRPRLASKPSYGN